MASLRQLFCVFFVFWVLFGFLAANAASFDVTALDSYEFLVKFFKMYEEFAKAPFYIAGESYAGKVSDC